MQVYIELSNPCISYLKTRIDSLISANHAKKINVDIGTEIYSLYYQLTEKSVSGKPVIGKGEAAAIALAKTYNGIVASNNLKDISEFIYEFSLEHITTGDILCYAFERGYITEENGNSIWSSMLSRRRKLGALSFTEYLDKQKITDSIK
jgi:actin-like ATPase involved in cell morphogenesis